MNSEPTPLGWGEIFDIVCRYVQRRLQSSRDEDWSDAGQNALVKVLKLHNSPDPPPIHRSLVVTMVEQAFTEIKRRKQLPATSGELDLQVWEVAKPAETLVRDEIFSLLNRLVAEMRSDWAVVVTKRCQLADCTWPQIAAQIGISVGAAKACWRRALNDLRQSLVREDVPVQDVQFLLWPEPKRRCS